MPRKPNPPKPDKPKPVGSRTGRRSLLLDDECKARLLQAVRLGCKYEHAAGAAGIGISTLMLWMQKGRDGAAGPYVEFLEEVTRARNEGALAVIARIHRAAQGANGGPGDWRADKFLLEVAFGYATSAHVRHTGVVEHRMEVSHEQAAQADAVLERHGYAVPRNGTDPAGPN